MGVVLVTTLVNPASIFGIAYTPLAIIDGEPRQDCPDARIGTRVLQDAQPIRLDGSVARAPDRELQLGGTAVGHRDHVLAPRLRPAHRALETAREPGDEDLLDAEQLGAEAAADVRRDDADVGRLEAEAPRQLVTVLMRRLGREPQRQAPVVSHDRGAAARLERARRHALAHEPPRHDGLAGVEEILVGLRRMAHADVRPGVGEEQHLARERLLRVDGNGQRLVVHERRALRRRRLRLDSRRRRRRRCRRRSGRRRARGTAAPSPGRARESAEAGTSRDRRPPP